MQANGKACATSFLSSFLTWRGGLETSCSHNDDREIRMTEYASIVLDMPGTNGFELIFTLFLRMNSPVPLNLLWQAISKNDKCC